ncbi:MAG TPA: amidophosphoribosyltransferase, partial [Gammaproteobacteria bacterium]|nr:amidophosphoribosyltransferase [Gammaproteobacteria bacterium]
REEHEVGEYLGADRLFYQNLGDLKQAVALGSRNITTFDASCFDGEYVTGDVDQAYLREIGLSRSDSAKQVSIDFGEEDEEVPVG